MTESDADPSKPLREVLSERQIEFIREESDVDNIEKILNSSLNDVMKSASKPDLTELMGQVTGQFDAEIDE